MEQAIYGNTALLRGLCPICGEMSFIKDSLTVCCRGEIEQPKEIKSVRESEARYVRHTPGKARQREILSDQHNLCFYCLNEFGMDVERKTLGAAQNTEKWGMVIFCNGGRWCYQWGKKDSPRKKVPPYKRTTLYVCWDHWEPFSYSANNKPDNFVAACQICNSYKSNICYGNYEDAREALRIKWDTNGWKII